MEHRTDSSQDKEDKDKAPLAGTVSWNLDCVPEQLAAQLAEAAAEHRVSVETLVVEVLSEYVRWERLAKLRDRSSHDEYDESEQGFTSWTEQVEFFHARLRSRAESAADGVEVEPPVQRPGVTRGGQGPAEG
ncbi:hypothetical protein [Corynebacterium aquilae]|nr:hypothetical protein [Corynebacterium aquilae]